MILSAISDSHWLYKWYHYDVNIQIAIEYVLYMAMD